MFEARHQDVLPVPRFVLRVVRFVGAAILLVVVALGIGVAGYHWVAGMGLVDAFLNASMILTGMGPVSTMPTTAAKLFAAFYALFSGLVFITVMGVILAPIAHRVLHRFHVDPEDRAG